MAAGTLPTTATTAIPLWHSDSPPPPDDDDDFHSPPTLAHATRQHAAHQTSNQVHPSSRSKKTSSSSSRPTSRHSPNSLDQQATQSIAPFLTRHIPLQYAPLGEEEGRSSSHRMDNRNTKYCYRHHPDLKCRRPVDEPSMDQLQSELSKLSLTDKAAISQVWSLFSAAPTKHRNLMLQGVLAQSCFPQLSFISASVRELLKIDFVAALPQEISVKILRFLDPCSLCKAAQVSTRWQALADDDVVWHTMCAQHIDRKCDKCGWGLPSMLKQKLQIEKREMKLRTMNQMSLGEVSRRAIPAPPAADRQLPPTRSVLISELESPKKGVKRLSQEPRSHHGDSSKRICDDASPEDRPRMQPWKNIYRERHRICINWKKMRHEMKTFKDHQNGVTCVDFDDNLLASGSYDTTVKVWDINTGDCLRTLAGHSLGIRCVLFDETKTKVISGSLDGSIKIWDIKTGNCVSNLPFHRGPVIGLHLVGAVLASASADHTIRIWDFNKGASAVIRGHNEWVNAVKIDVTSRTLLSGSDDCTARLWDLDSKKELIRFDGHVGQVQQVVIFPGDFEYKHPVTDGIDEFAEDCAGFSYGSLGVSDDDGNRPLPPRYMATGGLDGTIRMWDVHHNVCLNTFFGHLEGVWGLAADALRIVSASHDGMIKIWDPRSGLCEGTITSHTGPVTSIALNDRQICTGGEDNDVKVYNFAAAGLGRDRFEDSCSPEP